MITILYEERLIFSLHFRSSEYILQKVKQLEVNLICLQGLSLYCILQSLCCLEDFFYLFYAFYIY